MGQLERYGLYVLCLVIFLILGIAIWGDDSGIQDEGEQGVIRQLEATSKVGPDSITNEQLKALEKEARQNEVIEFIQERTRAQDANFASDASGPFAAAEPSRSAGGGDAGGKVPPTVFENAAPKEVTHTVVADQTLMDISMKYYGTHHKWRRIVQANPGVVPEQLRAGMKLRIPAVNTAAARRGASGTAPRTTPRTVPGTYTVCRGDTLGSLSKRFYGTTVYAGEIMRANNISDPTRMKLGSVLKIPPLSEVKKK